MRYAMLLVVGGIICFPFFLMWLVSAAVVNVGGFLLNVKREKRI